MVLKGFLRINTFSGEYGHLSDITEGVVLFKTGKEISVRIEKVSLLGDKAIVKFAGYDTPEDARSLTGGELWVNRNMAAPLHEGEHYISDIIGCSVLFNGEIKGSVVGVADVGHADLLEVKVGEKDVRYIPLKDEYVERVDTQQKQIMLKVDWILE